MVLQDIVQPVRLPQSSMRNLDHRQSSKRKSHLKRLTWILLAGLLLVSVAVLLWLKLNSKTQNLNSVNVIKSRVSRLYELPSNEEPALATVTNSQKLTSIFSGKVKDGDRVLIYQKNKKAIVYRPSLNKIVDVEPVTIDAPPSQT